MIGKNKLLLFFINFEKVSRISVLPCAAFGNKRIKNMKNIRRIDSGQETVWT